MKKKIVQMRRVGRVVDGSLCLSFLFVQYKRRGFILQCTLYILHHVIVHALK